MNRKTIIQIAVIIAAFGGSGIVLYNGFFKSSKPPAAINPTGDAVTGGNFAGSVPGATSQSPVKNIDKILPNGTALDFDSVLKRPGVQYNQITLPTVDPEKEVGLEVPLIFPPETKEGP